MSFQRLQRVSIFIRKNVARPQLMYLGLVSFAFSLCSALQLTNLSSLFDFFGVSGSSLPWLWLIPPLTGLVVQPIVGQLSDDTATRFGKRRPYLVGWGILTFLSLFFLPLSSSLFLALSCTWIIDCSINGGNEALRALTGDITKEYERSKAFTLQAFFGGIGAAIGTSLPVIMNKFHFVKERIKLGTVPPNLRYSFYAASIILIIILLWSVLKIREKPFKTTIFRKKTKGNVLTGTLKIFKEIYVNIKKMPFKFQKVCYIHALSWMGMFIFWLYFSTVIGQNFYHIPVFPQQFAKYASVHAKASLDSSYYFSIYQYVSILYAFGLYFLPDTARLKLIHGCSLLIGGAGILLIGFETTPLQIMLSTIAVGIMWGSLITLPYTIAMQAFPKGKTGIYLGIFNICITAPQLLCGLTLSPIYTFIFQRHAGYLVSFGGCLILLSSLFWIKYDKALK